jgi:FixJ family two-component response regulator
LTVIPLPNGEQERAMAPNLPKVLIVDDEETICDLVCEDLAEEGYVCDIASNAEDAFTKLETYKYDVALLDIVLPRKSGMDILRTIQECYQMTAVVMLTAVKDLDTAVEAMKLGAADYITKPFTLDKLNTSVSTALNKRKPRSAVSDTVSKNEGVNYSKDTDGRSLSEINAIAYGVDAQVDYFDFHSKIVTKETVKLAHWLGLPAKEIEKWAVARDELYSERDRRIKSMLSKLQRNPMAQVMLGLTRSVYQFPELGEEQN